MNLHYYKIPIDKFDYDMPFRIGHIRSDYAYVATVEEYEDETVYISITEEELLAIENNHNNREPEPTEEELVQAEILLALTKQQNQLDAIEAKLNQ